MNATSSETTPHWDLTTVYPALDSPEYLQDLADLTARLAELEAFTRDNQLNGSAAPAEDAGLLAARINGYLDRMNAAQLLFRTLATYTFLQVSVDSYNAQAKRKLSEIEQLGVRLDQQSVPFETWLGQRADYLADVIAGGGAAAQHAFYLQEKAEQSRYLMSEREEALASELSLSGAEAWGKLQGTVCSQLSVAFEMDGSVKKLPITALINLRSDPDPDVRRRAYEAELEAWKTVSEPLAAAMNGIKGAAVTLHKRRGRSDALHASLDQARIDRSTLEAMLAAMQDSFPVFRSYLRKKAARLGKPSLPWYDLFAPAGRVERQLSFPQAQTFIIEQFGHFSGELADFARTAFELHWIDAEPRGGKRGGAFCSPISAREESRILCNFDGSMDQTFTIAHELGHGFHNACMKGKTSLQRSTPMTLAETASTFCETIVTEAALSQASSADEALAILETYLIGATQVIVDISSRFLFEKELFERRERAELSAEELGEIMLKSQKATYGDGLDERYLQPYMWTWKPHYYNADLHFYNYPYAFGLLFGTGLYAIFQQRGASFLPDYKALLASTGEANAADLAARFGIDIRTPAFWQSSLKVIEKRIQEYNSL